jgi:hypothetical protein
MQRYRLDATLKSNILNLCDQRNLTQLLMTCGRFSSFARITKLITFLPVRAIEWIGGLLLSFVDPPPNVLIEFVTKTADRILITLSSYSANTKFVFHVSPKNPYYVQLLIEVVPARNIAGCNYVRNTFDWL